MRRFRRLPLVVCLASLTLTTASSRASCAAPSVAAMPNERRAGQLVLITGEGWSTGCDDVEGQCSGCGSCDARGEDEGHVVERVTVLLRGQGMEVRLKTLTLDTASFAVEMRLPSDLAPGRYRLVARGEPGAFHARRALRIFD